MRFVLFLALKYIRPKRSVASAITLVSVAGVALGVAAVVIVRSVMTGFGDEWRAKILGFKPHIAIVCGDSSFITGEEELARSLRAVPGVVNATPEIDSRILFSNKDRVSAPVIIGLGEGGFVKSFGGVRRVAGSFDLEPDSLVVGWALAKSAGVWLGDCVTVCAPPLPDEVYLPRKWKITGIFSSGHYEYDSGYAVADIDSVRDLLGVEEGVGAIHLKTYAPLDGPAFDAVVKALPVDRSRMRVLTWREADRQLFDALAVETNMTAVLLLLISIVALFCVMNTLLVIGVQKTPETGLLKALGCSRLKIAGVFLVHGAIQCAIGISLGLLASWAVLSNLQNIVAWLGRMGMEVFPPAVYGLSEIPHRVVVSDIAWTVGVICVFGIFASLVPAMIAASKDPVKALGE